MSAINDDAPLLQARKVCKSFGTVTGCQDVDLEIYPGEVLGIVGESGSGKSTLLRCLSGDHALQSGHVTYAMRTGEIADVHVLGMEEHEYGK